MFGSTKIGSIFGVAPSEFKRGGGGNGLGDARSLKFVKSNLFQKSCFFSPKTGEIYLSRIPTLSMPSVYETYQFVEKHNTK